MSTPEITPEPLLAPVGQLAADPGPVPMLAGTFALYQAPDGGFVLVTDVDGEQTRKHIPGAIVKMVTGEGVMGKHMRRLMGG